MEEYRIGRIRYKMSFAYPGYPVPAKNALCDPENRYMR